MRRHASAHVPGANTPAASTAFTAKEMRFALLLIVAAAALAIATIVAQRSAMMPPSLGAYEVEAVPTSNAGSERMGGTQIVDAAPLQDINVSGGLVQTAAN